MLGVLVQLADHSHRHRRRVCLPGGEHNGDVLEGVVRNLQLVCVLRVTLRELAKQWGGGGGVAGE